jgi:hypothetical protein
VRRLDVPKAAPKKAINEPAISIAEALLSFNQFCHSLLDRKANRAYLNEITLKPLPSKFYSTAICLAAQQVLVVEQMLDQDEYSSRAYFPWYRKTLDIQVGSRHENPLAGSDFQQIWSTLRSEVQSVRGSSAMSITFKAGKGVDLNRNLPFSQALLTHQDLSFLHNAEASLVVETDDLIIKLLHRLRSNFNRRAKELISKASSDERLRQRLCEQIRSFKVNTQQQAETFFLREDNTDSPEWLVAYRDLDNWIDQIYCLFRRSEPRPFDQIPTDDFISKLITENGMIALVRRDDHYKQISKTEPFIPHDSVMLLVARGEVASVKNRFSQTYPNLTISNIASNLSEQFQLLDCGSMPHSLLFDPQGKVSSIAIEPDFQFLGGLVVDARSNTFLTGYPPTALLHCGEKIAAHLKLTVNGVEISLDAFLRKLIKTRNLSSYVIEVFGNRVELTLSPANLQCKSQVLLGFALDGGLLNPIATSLNESQPSLRGTLLIDEPIVSENALVSLSAADLLVLTHRGKRKKLSKQSLNVLEDAVRQSKQYPQLIQVIVRDLCRTKSVPIEALQASTIRALLKGSIQQ